MEMSHASKTKEDALPSHGSSIVEQRSELEIEYDRWKATAVSLLQGMKESSTSFGYGQGQYNAGGYLDERGAYRSHGIHSVGCSWIAALNGAASNKCKTTRSAVSQASTDFETQSYKGVLKGSSQQSMT